MAKKTGDYQIPFDKDGNQMHYPQPSYDWPDGWGSDKPRVQTAPIWRDNDPFTDELTFDDYARGRSAAYFHFKRSDGSRVCFFMKEMTEIVPLMTRGKINGTFQFVKRGENYGARIVGHSIT